MRASLLAAPHVEGNAAVVAQVAVVAHDARAEGRPLAARARGRWRRRLGSRLVVPVVAVHPLRRGGDQKWGKRREWRRGLALETRVFRRSSLHRWSQGRGLCVGVFAHRLHSFRNKIHTSLHLRHPPLQVDNMIVVMSKPLDHSIHHPVHQFQRCVLLATYAASHAGG